MDSSTAVANYTSQLMASRLTDAMWLIEQVMWKGFDVRLARFLVEEASLEEQRPSPSRTSASPPIWVRLPRW